MRHRVTGKYNYNVEENQSMKIELEIAQVTELVGKNSSLLVN
jgi:hypothetical protein